MGLSSREKEVLVLICQGLCSQEVADKLFVSKRTIDFHLSNIYAKLDVKNRIQAWRKALGLGLLSYEDQLSR